MPKKKQIKQHEKLLDAAWEEFSKSNYDRANEIANQVISKHPDEIRAIALIAHIDFTKNRFTDAIEGFKLCLDLDKEKKLYGYLYYWIGRVYDFHTFRKKNKLHNSKRANEYYKKALDHKNYPPDLFLRLFQKKKSFTDKKNLLERGIREFPEFITFYVRLYSISKLANNSNLLHILNEGFIKTKSSTIGFLIGKYYEENHKYSEATAQYLQSLETAKDLDKMYLYFSLGISFYRNRELKKAIEYLNKIPNEDLGYLYLISRLQSAYIYFLEGDNNSASASLEEIYTNENLFEIEFNDIVIWLDSEYAFEIDHEIDLTIFERKIRELRKNIKNEFKEPVNYIYILLLKRNGKHSYRFRALRKLINEASPDYLLKEYISCYSDWLDYLIEKNKDIKNTLKALLDDIMNNYNFRQKIIKEIVVINKIVDHLFSNELYDKIILFDKELNNEELKELGIWFELAYSYAELDDLDHAEKAYNYEIQRNASFNNLSLMKEKKGNLDEALRLISEAKKLEPDNELYERNFIRIKQSCNEQHQKTLKFKEAIAELKNETDFAISRLSYFIKNIKAERSFKKNKLPIPNWMFPKLIGANKELANSLKEQWLKKQYIVKTDERGEYNVPFYEINPLIEKSLEEINVCKLDEKWTNGFSMITKEVLEEIEYFKNLLRINKVNKKYRYYILRDYKELTINYLLKNEKATVILAGSLTECLLTYYCDKKKIGRISCLNSKNKQISKKLYECELYDLIKFFEANNILKSDFYHLNNLSRIYRNYVHPGKELRDMDILNMNKAKICFIGVSELLNNIL